MRRAGLFALRGAGPRATALGVATIVLGILALPAAAGPKGVAALAPIEIPLDGQRELAGVAVAPDGSFYVSDRKAGTVLRLAPTAQLTIAVGGLDHPVGVAFDPAGRLLIAEERQGRVLRLEALGTLTVLASGIRRPRWMAVAPDGALYIAATWPGPAGRPHQDHGEGDRDDDRDDHDVILRRDPTTGGLAVVATGLHKLEALVLNGRFLYATARRVRGLSRVDGAIVRYAVLPDGFLGTPSYVPASGTARRPRGLALDRFGALYVGAAEIRVNGTRVKRAIGKAHPDGTLTVLAHDLEDPQGLALAPDGSLYAADGARGRLLRFRAPPAPSLIGLPEFTNQSPLAVTGAAEPSARIDLFVGESTTPESATATSAGTFTASVTLTPNAPNALEVFATARRGAGLTSEAATASVTHDSVAPSLAFEAPPFAAHVGGQVLVQAEAADGGSGLANLALGIGTQPLPATVAPAPPASALTASTTWDTTTVGDGAVELTAIATDRAGNTAGVTRFVVIDNTPPDTQITDGPSGETSERTATFTFTGTDPPHAPASLQFAWSLDGGPFTPFSLATTATFAGLADGVHTFAVTARDLAGNEDPTPARRTFTVLTGPTISAVEPASGRIGTLVTITGGGFEPDGTSVRFDGVAAVIRTIDATSLTTTVPVGATTGPLVVTTPRGSASRGFTVTTSGEFTLTAAPTAVRAIAGDQTSVSIGAAGGGAFASLVSLRVSTPPAGIGATFHPALVAPGGTASLTLDVANTVAPGRFDFTVTGQGQVDGQTLTRSASVVLEVLAPETTAVTGRVLTADALPEPIPGVTVTLGSAFTLTDAGGNFVLLSPPTGANMLLVDGRTASTPTAQYPPVEVNIPVHATGPTRVPFIVFLPKLDTANPVTLPIDGTGTATETVEATTPTIPDLAVTIPAGTRIIGPDGNPVRQVTITPVPVDRSPMPLPPGVSAAQLFTIQPGGAVPSRPLPITFPNAQGAPPGRSADLYFFDLATGGWQVWGTGTVSPDGRQIVSDPGFGLPRFAWHFAFTPTSLPDQVRGRHAKGGEPVDLVTGRFTVSKTDLVLPARLPVAIQRHYRSEDPRPGLFGIGWNLAPYDTRLTATGTSLSLILPDRSTYLLTPSGPGQWTNSTEPFLRGAVATQLPGDFIFQIRFKDGTIHRFERIVGFANLAALARISDRNGNAVTLVREEVFQQNRITQIVEPAGRRFALAYDAAGRITTITDPIGRRVQYAYDGLGRLSAVTDPAGGTTRYTYDADHRILTITDPRGITFLTNEYDAAGRVARQVQADGGAWRFAYGVTGGRVTETTVTDPGGNPTTHRFNSQGFTLSTTDALGQTTAFTYTADNLLASTTDPLGRVTRLEYDPVGNVTRIVDPAGSSRIFTYEPTFNTVLSVMGPLGDTIRFERDPRGNLSAVIDALGNRTVIDNDSFGQPIVVTGPLGNAISFTYDTSGNPVTITDPLGNAATLTYDAASRLVEQTDSRGRTTRFGYDALDRLTILIDAPGSARRAAYDGNGNLITVTDSLGHSTTHVYDSIDRLLTRTDPAGRREDYAYSAAGNLVRYTDRDGGVATYTYDALGRRVAATYADGSVTDFAYDAGGRLVQATDSLGGTIVYEHDVLDRLVAETSTVGTVTYEYDALDRRVAMTASGQARVTYSYDGASRLTQVEQEGRTVVLRYDTAGRRTGLALPNGVVTEYQYDLASRLTALAFRNADALLGDLTYDYDAGGNVAALSGSLARTLLPDAVATASYDTANRQLTFGAATLAYDARGNLTSIADDSGVTALTWDGRNRLVHLTGPSLSAAFVYDAFGRRLSKTINGSTTRYLYDGPDIVHEVQDGVPISYLRLLNVDTPVSRNSDEFYLADHLGSVVALTDAGGAITTRYVYDPFGRTIADGRASANPFQFTGRENDETGLYYYRARYYAPRLHRFSGQDLIMGFGANRYAYVRNNPLIAIDPFGLETLIINGGFPSSGPGGSSAGANPLNPGLYKLQAKLQAAREPVFVYNSGQERSVVTDAKRIRAAGRPVYLVGHSFGAQAAIAAAIELHGLGMTPDHVFTIDPFVQDGTTIPPGIPLTNFLQQSGWIRGREIAGAQENVLILGTTHFTITAHEAVQAAITSTVLRGSQATPALGGRY